LPQGARSALCAVRVAYLRAEGQAGGRRRLRPGGRDRFEAFLRSIGCPTRLSELHIGKTMLPRYAQDMVRIVHDAEGRLPGRRPIREADIFEVLHSAL
jgi:alcohol dehydrogenase class IV